MTFCRTRSHILLSMLIGLIFGTVGIHQSFAQTGLPPDINFTDQVDLRVVAEIVDSPGVASLIENAFLDGFVWQDFSLGKWELSSHRIYFGEIVLRNPAAIEDRVIEFQYVHNLSFTMPSLLNDELLFRLFLAPTPLQRTNVIVTNKNQLKFFVSILRNIPQRLFDQTPQFGISDLKVSTQPGAVDYFTLRLNYQQVQSSGGSASFTRRISAFGWSTRSGFALGPLEYH